MADFYLWNKDTLVRFAEDASACMAAQEAAMAVQDETIADLEVQVKAVHESWRQALALTVPSATLTPRECGANRDYDTPWEILFPQQPGKTS